MTQAEAEMRDSEWIKGKSSSHWGKAGSGAGCSERLCSLHPQRFQDQAGQSPEQLGLISQVSLVWARDPWAYFQPESPHSPVILSAPFRHLRGIHTQPGKTGDLTHQGERWRQDGIPSTDFRYLGCGHLSPFIVSNNKQAWQESYYAKAGV